MLIGVDPGLHGAICIIKDNKIRLIKMPLKDGQVDSAQIFHLFAKADRNSSFFIESLLVFKDKQGSQGLSTSGKNWGRVMAVAEILEFDIHEVKAQEWQKALLVPAGYRETVKQRIYQRAKILFPKVDFVPHGCRKPHDGFVDALMIAKYGSMKLKEKEKTNVLHHT